MKYNDWLDDWLEMYIKHSVKTHTYINYATVARYYIRPYLGEKQLEALKPTVLQKYVARLSQSGNKKGKALSPRTVRLAINIVQMSLKEAVDAGIVAEQFTEKIKRPRPKEQRMNCFSPEEQKEIERAVLSRPIDKRFGILLSLYTGMRIGEIVALRWKDIDFENKLLYVNATCRDTYVNGKYKKVLDTPKTRSSRRIIPLPEPIVKYLLIIRKYSQSVFVVASGKDDVSERSYQMTFSLFLKKLGIPHRSFHALRHTFATRALECGMDVRTLAEILGHTNPTVTLTRYAHSMFEHKVNMMNRMGSLLTEPGN